MGAIDERRLQDLLEGERFVSRILVLPSAGSTNGEALKLAAEGAPEGTVVIADAQTAGRGRLGRAWHSPPGAGLYFSVLLRPSGPVEDWPRWTIASALAICEGCRAVSGCDVAIEWPNDLLLEGRKVGGILTEGRSSGARSLGLVVGIGINVNQEADDFSPEIRQRAVSLRMGRRGASVDREDLAARCLGEMARVADTLALGRWDLLREAWTRRAPGGQGWRVRVSPESLDARRGSFEGTTRGLDEIGALLVERETGDLVAVHAADSVVFLEAR